MKASISWLQKYVDIQTDIPALINTLTMLGLEVEGVERPYAFLDSVKVAQIESISPHPSADRLRCCKVNTGSEILSIVCGAPNAKEGMVVPLATIGTTMPNGVLIAATHLRGEPSNGMLCSASELGLEEKTNGLLELDSSFPLGISLGEALCLNDIVLDVSITPNRPDCLSMIGLARELAANKKTSLRFPEIKLVGAKLPSPKNIVTIEKPDICPRYVAQVLENIEIGHSPSWMQNLLRAVGIRPINNVVDITNFVMMEMGQPLHAFDYDRLHENRIVVKTASDNMKFTTLDGKTHSLTKEMLLICDGKEPIAIAGVMGGLDSEISFQTKRVLIESAYFHPTSVRKTARKLGIKTEAAHRYERGIDPELPLKALHRTVSLLIELADAKPVTAVIDVNPKPHMPVVISLTTEKTNRLLGTQLTDSEIKELLESIEFTVSGKNSPFKVSPPSFRVDVSIEEDLIEEIARLYGYDHIVETLPCGAYHTEPDPVFSIREKSKEMFQGFGFSEVINYCFIHNSFCDQLCFSEKDERRKIIPVLNPISEDLSVMRTSLLPGLLLTTQRNIAQQIRDVKIFETGKVFLSNGKDVLPTEIEMIAALWSGAKASPSWHEKQTETDFFDIKGVLEAYFISLKIADIRYVSTSHENLSWTKAGFSADIMWKDFMIGQVGQINPKTLAYFDIKQPAFAFELNLNTLSGKLSKTQAKASEVRYPSSSRDITLILNQTIFVQEVFDLILGLQEPLVDDVFLFDVYEGGSIGKDKRSLSFRITYRSTIGTLEEKDILPVHQKISDALVKELKATFPV